MDEKILSVYAIADTGFTAPEELPALVEAMLAGGVRLLQLRAKDMEGRAFLELAQALLQRCRAAGALFLVNDRVDVAHACRADGVHLGQKDLPARAARAILGPQAIIGVSARTEADARRARDDGADYLGTGAVFPSGTKGSAAVIGVEGLASIVKLGVLPVVGIGGIDETNIAQVRDAGAAGASLISGIARGAGTQAQARRLTEIWQG